MFRFLWQPEFLMLAVSAIIFILMFIIAFIIRIFAVFVKGRIFYNDTLTITIWSSVPLLILLPISIVLIRLLVFSESISWIILLIPVILDIWVLARILKATSVVYDVLHYKAYLIGIGFLAVVITTKLVIYQYEISIFAYMQYFKDVLLKF